MQYKSDGMAELFETMGNKNPKEAVDRVSLDSMASGLYKFRRKCPKVPDNCRGCREKKDPPFSMFPCGHTFCKKCVEKAVEKINCVDCRSEEPKKKHVMKHIKSEITEGVLEGHEKSRLIK